MKELYYFSPLGIKIWNESLSLGYRNVITKNSSGVIAVLNVLRIINEPTAAAVAYGLIKGWRGEKNILILIRVEKTLTTTWSTILWRKRMQDQPARELHTQASIDSIFLFIYFLISITVAFLEELNSFRGILLPGRSLERCQKKNKQKKNPGSLYCFVGSSKRNPKIQKHLQDAFNGRNKNISPDEAVAYGTWATLVKMCRTYCCWISSANVEYWDC